MSIQVFENKKKFSTLAFDGIIFTNNNIMPNDMLMSPPQGLYPLLGISREDAYPLGSNYFILMQALAKKNMKL